MVASQQLKVKPHEVNRNHFADNRRKHTTKLLYLPNSLISNSILEVTVTNTLSMSEHIDRVLSNAQSVFALDIASTRTKSRTHTTFSTLSFWQN